MHLAMGCVLIQIFSFEQPPDVQKKRAALIVIGETSFIAYHCITDEFVLHVVLFITLSFTVGWKTRRLIKERIKDEAHRRKLSALVNFGTSNLQGSTFQKVTFRC